MQYVPDSRLRSTVSRLTSDYQLLDQHLSTTLSAPLSCLIITCHPLYHRLISCAISAYSMARSVPVIHFISTCQPLYQHLSTAWSATTLLRDQFLLSHVIRDPQPVDQRLSAAWPAPVRSLIRAYQPLDNIWGCSFSEVLEAEQVAGSCFHPEVQSGE